jgi:dienelactone hydrolase
MLRATLLLACAATLAAQAPAPAPYKVPQSDLDALREAVKPLTAKAAALKANPLTADVAVYEKAVQYLLRFPDQFYDANFVKHAHAAIAAGLARAAELEAGKPSWVKQTGRVPRAYRSRVDGSFQPYRLNIPASYDGAKPVRLDVILHGRNARLTEASFLAVDPKAKPLPETQDFIELEVYGRGNNAYRWAGETDVFEALAAVQAQYKIDPDRILLRGFSMGGAGAWHIGLHHPSTWAGVEAGAGFTDTLVYANRKNPPAYERAAMHIYDAVDYAANVSSVPTVGYGGELDKQLQASINIRDALAFERIDARTLFLVGPQTEHRWHPDKKAESEAFLKANLPRQRPERFRFVTWTPRYGRVWNFRIVALDNLYARAQLDVDGTNVTTSNILEFELDAPAEITLDGQKLRGAAFVRNLNSWAVRERPSRLRKMAGLQGPIDDAFLDRFLCVAPGPDPRLEEFAANFARHMRGDVPRKSPNAVTKADVAEANLILFGTPATNKWIKDTVKKLPVTWDDKKITVAGKTFDAATHTLALIQPNPLNPSRYVVYNSGHTFGKSEFEGTNALLYPRLGDWAVFETATGKVAAAGLFSSAWQ